VPTSACLETVHETGGCRGRIRALLAGRRSADLGPAHLKEQAHGAFEAEDYPRAIALLRQAVQQDSADAEAWYYLGYYTHYLCYDSVPLTGYSDHSSDEVLALLERAVALDPKLGNACYFIGAEYGGRFLNQMQRGNLKGMVAELKAGKARGGFPDWLVEYNRNMLRSCDDNAILFTGGDAEAGSAWYLQYVEGFRRDVTVIPVAVLRWPWYVLALKEKRDLIPAGAPISWSRIRFWRCTPTSGRPSGYPSLSRMPSERRMPSPTAWTMSSGCSNRTSMTAAGRTSARSGPSWPTYSSRTGGGDRCTARWG